MAKAKRGEVSSFSSRFSRDLMDVQPLRFGIIGGSLSLGHGCHCTPFHKQIFDCMLAQPRVFLTLIRVTRVQLHLPKPRKRTL
jgi:hypothetical protein